MNQIKNSYERPDGREISAYAGCSEWSARHWAWEFLRRNAKFIEACDSCAAERTARLEVAQKFGLKKLKHYREPYFCKDIENPARRPVFLEGAISVKSNMTVQTSGHRAVKLQLEYGQVAVIFDLRKTLKKERSVRKMLELAENSVLRRQKRILRHSEPDAAIKNQPKGSKFLIYLRFLDLLDADIDRGEALRIANGQEDQKAGVVSGQKLQQVEEAKACCEHRYLEIALMKKKKPAKK